MISTKPQVDLSNLLQLCSHCMGKKTHLQASTILIISDISGISERSNKSDYVIKLKLVDEFVNNANRFGAMCRFLSMYITSEVRENLANIGNIGDVILLHKFNFSIWSNMLVETKYTGSVEQMVVFSWDSLEVSHTERCSVDDSILQEKAVKNRKEEIRDWFHTEINDKIFNPKVGIMPNSKFGMILEPLNMILRKYNHKDDLKYENLDENMMVLADREENNHYLIRLSPIRIEQLEFE